MGWRGCRDPGQETLEYGGQGLWGLSAWVPVLASLLTLGMAGRIMPPQRCFHPNPWNLGANMLTYPAEGTLQTSF